MKQLVVVLILFVSVTLSAQVKPLFNMSEIRDASTLEVEVIQDWHVVKGAVETRQKVISIKVCEYWDVEEYRVPVRFIVPVDRKAKGFYLSGSNMPKKLENDFPIHRDLHVEFIKGGIGIVQTVLQNLSFLGEAELEKKLNKTFVETLDPFYSVQYYAWPALLMRAITAAYSEIDYFEVGKIALSGASKNGASPSIAIIHDERMTAIHAAVSPIWPSPLRLCDVEAWDALKVENRDYAERLSDAGEDIDVKRMMNHFFLGGTNGPVYNQRALREGHSWDDIKHLAEGLSPQIFISENIDQFETRNVDMYFSPGTHDYVNFDISWGGKYYQNISLYLKANSGHQQTPHPAAEKDEDNLSAFLLHHFFDDAEPLSEAPTSTYELDGKELTVKVKFKANSEIESGRIWWMYDRGSDGSASYIREMIPDENWMDMSYDKQDDTWTVKLDIDSEHTHIDFFSNHKKVIEYSGKEYLVYISSPYTRAMSKGQ